MTAAASRVYTSYTFINKICLVLYTLFSQLKVVDTLQGIVQSAQLCSLQKQLLVSQHSYVKLTIVYVYVCVLVCAAY